MDPIMGERSGQFFAADNSVGQQKVVQFNVLPLKKSYSYLQPGSFIEISWGLKNCNYNYVGTPPLLYNFSKKHDHCWVIFRIT